MSSNLPREGPASGAATAATVTALKIQHEQDVCVGEENMQKQREVIERQPENADEANVSVATD